jgi:hypothetical protein
MRPSLLALTLLLSACGPIGVQTPAKIFRFESAGPRVAFRNCVVTLGWTETQLLDACGQPDFVVPTVGSPETYVFLYRSLAHAIGTQDSGCPVFGVEVGLRKFPRPKPGDLPTVVSVYGLSEIPVEVTATPAGPVPGQ